MGEVVLGVLTVVIVLVIVGAIIGFFSDPDNYR